MHIAPCLILLAASACLLCEGYVIPLRSTLCPHCPPRAHGSDAPGDPSLSSEFPFHLSIRRGVGHTLRLGEHPKIHILAEGIAAPFLWPTKILLKLEEFYPPTAMPTCMPLADAG
jgi:hypothetical protein